MYIVTRRNPNGVPVAEPASVECRTGIGAALRALRWTRVGYAVEIRTRATDLVSRIRSRPAPRAPLDLSDACVQRLPTA